MDFCVGSLVDVKEIYTKWGLLMQMCVDGTNMNNTPVDCQHNAHYVFTALRIRWRRMHNNNRTHQKIRAFYVAQIILIGQCVTQHTLLGKFAG